LGVQRALVEQGGQDSRVVGDLRWKMPPRPPGSLFSAALSVAVSCVAGVLDATDPIAAEIRADHMTANVDRVVPGRSGRSSWRSRACRRASGRSLPGASEVLGCRTYPTPTVGGPLRGESALPVRGRVAMIPEGPRPGGLRC
jgi:hypothetical protein